MADSTRRSGRATKGQHSRALEPEDVPTPPKRGGKGTKSKRNEPTPPPEGEGPAIIRCICGYVVEDADDERKMICCESCDAWQHNECMGMSDDDDELPEKYYCEQCHPRDHKDLLAQVARGEKPWEELQRQRELEEQSRKGRKGKGKKGRKPGRPSAVQKEIVQENGAVDDSAMDIDTTPAQVEQPTEVEQPPQEEKVEEKKAEENEAEEEKVEETKVEEKKVEEKKVEEKKAEDKVEGTKRKLPEDNIAEARSPSQAEPPSKTRKITSPSNETPSLPLSSRRKSGAPASKKRDSTAGQPQLELVEQPSDLQSGERQRVATALVKLFKDLTMQAEKQGAFSLPKGQKVDEFGNKLGLLVEQAIFMHFWSGTGKAPEAYAHKFRTISHNAKKNPSLRDRVLSGSLSPSDFSKMEPKDMASEELQEMKEEMLKESEKQHVLIQDEGPRMRRTHKGEELVEDESHIADSMDSAFVAPVRKRASEIDSSVVKQASPETENPQSPAAVEVPETFGAGSTSTAQPLVLDTNVESRASAAPERKSANNFNIQEVWQGVKGPDPETQRTRQASRPSEPLIQQPQGSGVKADPEIDQLLKDEEPEDEEPYSPIDYTAEPGSNIWHGRLTMAGIASFHGTGRHVAGADLSATLPWHTLVPTTLTIEGRISTERAEEYLCSLKWSTTTDVIVIAVTPNSDAESQVQFDKLFTYFTERKRYGVIGKSPVPSVKDTYVVTLDAGAGKKPDFVEMLEYCIIEDPRPERTLLLTFAVKLNNSPSAQTPRHVDAASIASPIGTSGPQTSNMGQHSTFQGSPTAFAPPQHLPPYASSPTQMQHAYMPPHHQSPYPPQQQQYGGAGVTGIDAARQALGELAGAPVVSELLKEAPRSGVAMGVPEFLVLRESLQSVPAARVDLTMLKGLLTVKNVQKGESAAQ